MRQLLGPVPCDFLEFEELELKCQTWLDKKGDGLKHIVTLNPEMVVLAAQDSHFLRAVERADLVVPDGAGLFWARDYLQRPHANLWPSLLKTWQSSYERLSGRQITIMLAKLAQRLRQKIFILGSTSVSAQQAALKLKRDFPGLVVQSHGGSGHDPSGPPELLQAINSSQASILLVAYGAPQQTTWIEANRFHLASLKLAIGVGGTIDQLSGRQRVAPLSWQQHNLEWLWRVVQEPKRLPRIWRATITFPRLVQAQKSKISSTN